MNEFQRQLLADAIDENERRVENYEAAIAKLEKQLRVKKERLAQLRLERDKLEEGVDW